MDFVPNTIVSFIRTVGDRMSSRTTIEHTSDKKYVTCLSTRRKEVGIVERGQQRRGGSCYLDLLPEDVLIRMLLLLGDTPARQSIYQTPAANVIELSRTLCVLCMLNKSTSQTFRRTTEFVARQLLHLPLESTPLTRRLDDPSWKFTLRWSKQIQAQWCHSERGGVNILRGKKLKYGGNGCWGQYKTSKYDCFYRSFELRAGTYDIEIVGRMNFGCGKLRLEIDGAPVTNESIDFYSPVLVVPCHKIVSRICIRRSGKHVLVGKVDGTNDRSRGRFRYAIPLRSVHIRLAKKVHGAREQEGEESVEGEDTGDWKLVCKNAENPGRPCSCCFCKVSHQLE